MPKIYSVTIEDYRDLRDIIKAARHPNASVQEIRKIFESHIQRHVIGFSPIMSSDDLLKEAIYASNLIDKQSIEKAADKINQASEKSGDLTFNKNNLYCLKTYLAILPLIASLTVEQKDKKEARSIAYKLAILFNDENLIYEYLLALPRSSAMIDLRKATLFKIDQLELLSGKEREEWQILAKRFLIDNRKNEADFLKLLSTAKRISAIKALLPSNKEAYQKEVNPQDRWKVLSVRDVVLSIYNETLEEQITNAKAIAIKKMESKFAVQIEKAETKYHQSDSNTESTPFEAIKAELLEQKAKAIKKYDNASLWKGHEKQYIDKLCAPLSKSTIDILLFLNEFCQYSRYAENIHAARILKKIDVDEVSFNKYLTIISKTPPKNSDEALPFVFIEGEEVGCPGFNIIKLSDDDPKNPFAGELIGCCQRIGSVGETCAIHSMSAENGCVYVLFKGKISDKLRREVNEAHEKGITPDTSTLIASKSVEAIAWSWRSYRQAPVKTEYSDVVVFDNISCSTNINKHLDKVRILYKELAKRLVHQSHPNKPINIVHTGERWGVKDIGLLSVAPAQLIDSDTLTIKNYYSDASTQFLVYNRNELVMGIIDALEDSKRLKWVIEEKCQTIKDLMELIRLVYELPIDKGDRILALTMNKFNLVSEDNVNTIFSKLHYFSYRDHLFEMHQRIIKRLFQVAPEKTLIYLLDEWRGDILLALLGEIDFKNTVLDYSKAALMSSSRQIQQLKYFLC